MLFNDRFKYTSKTRIDKGISGYIEICENKAAGTVFAIKTYHQKEKYESKSEYHTRVLHEFRILQKLHHPNIITVYRESISFTGSTVKIFMEAGSVDFSSLLKRGKYGTFDSLFSFWKQLHGAIKYLHGMEICHRDLKLDNLVLVGGDTLKVIDFGSATSTANGELAVGIVGTESYASPESYSKISYDGKKADIWSIGIILYYFICRRFPWKIASHSDKAFVQKTAASVTDDLDSGYLGPYYAPIVEILTGILQPDPVKRLSIADLDHYIALAESTL
ncbi:hypothetical protein CLIB1423_38S00518 [[Candida] railenensis]|uniref:Protein kinase domain-containing protein n=1 Tax=[Candida] railenensis TaxID=45579 RepID=A0A9P0W1D2_9ASCO|nr:hypothetical protein CLIB1423_38S00518 [[Candida] railenensis]